MTTRIPLLALATIVALPLLLTGSADAGQPPDHLYCLSSSDPVPNLRATADLFPLQNPPFDIQNCRIRLRSGNTCVPANKFNVRDRNGDPVDTFPFFGGPAQPYLCYQVRCPPESPRGTREILVVEDQLGQREIEIRRADFFCAPGEVPFQN